MARVLFDALESFERRHAKNAQELVWPVFAPKAGCKCFVQCTLNTTLGVPQAKDLWDIIEATHGQTTISDEATACQSLSPYDHIDWLPLDPLIDQLTVCER